MQTTDKGISADKSQTIIRIGKQSLRFVSIDAEGRTVSEPYIVKSGMSIAANLREAFKDSEILTSLSGQQERRATVLLDTNVLPLPLEEYHESEQDIIFRHSFPDRSHEVVMHHVVGSLNCVVLFGINKDLRTVLSDNFSSLKILPAIVPVWEHLFRQSSIGRAMKVYCYFHDKKMDIFVFRNRYLLFANSYSATTANDASYFTLYAFKQLGLNQKKDEVFMAGDAPEGTRQMLQRWIANTYQVSASAEYNRHPVTQIPNIQYDTSTYILDNCL